MSNTTFSPSSQSSTNWIIILNNAVQLFAMFVSAIATAARVMNECRATSLNARIDAALHNVEADIKDAIERRLLKESDACGDSTVGDALKG